MMEKIAGVLFDTWYGAVAACAATGAVMLAGVLFSCWTAGEAVAAAFAVPWGLSVLAWVAALARSLWKRAWGRAAAQLGIGAAGTVLFAAAGMGAMVGSEAIADMAGPGPWRGAKEKNGVVPFEVECRLARPVPMFSGGMVIFERRVAFASGKRVAVDRKPAGACFFEVCAFEDGTYGLEDPLGYRYRVDAAAETVEESLEDGWEGREVLGKFLPGGRFARAQEGMGGGR